MPVLLAKHLFPVAALLQLVHLFIHVFFLLNLDPYKPLVISKVLGNSSTVLKLQHCKMQW